MASVKVSIGLLFIASIGHCHPPGYFRKAVHSFPQPYIKDDDIQSSYTVDYHPQPQYEYTLDDRIKPNYIEDYRDEAPYTVDDHIKPSYTEDYRIEVPHTEDYRIEAPYIVDDLIKPSYIEDYRIEPQYSVDDRNKPPYHGHHIQSEPYDEELHSVNIPLGNSGNDDFFKGVNTEMNHIFKPDFNLNGYSQEMNQEFNWKNEQSQFHDPIYQEFPYKTTTYEHSGPNYELPVYYDKEEYVPYTPQHVKKDLSSDGPFHQQEYRNLYKPEFDQKYQTIRFKNHDEPEMLEAWKKNKIVESNDEDVWNILSKDNDFGMKKISSKLNSTSPTDISKVVQNGEKKNLKKNKYKKSKDSNEDKDPESKKFANTGKNTELNVLKKKNQLNTDLNVINKKKRLIFENSKEGKEPESKKVENVAKNIGLNVEKKKIQSNLDAIKKKNEITFEKLKQLYEDYLNMLNEYPQYGIPPKRITAKNSRVLNESEESEYLDTENIDNMQGDDPSVLIKDQESESTDTENIDNMQGDDPSVLIKDQESESTDTENIDNMQGDDPSVLIKDQESESTDTENIDNMQGDDPGVLNESKESESTDTENIDDMQGDDPSVLNESKESESTDTENHCNCKDFEFYRLHFWINFMADVFLKKDLEDKHEHENQKALEEIEFVEDVNMNLFKIFFNNNIDANDNSTEQYTTTTEPADFSNSSITKKTKTNHKKLHKSKKSESKNAENSDIIQSEDLKDLNESKESEFEKALNIYLSRENVDLKNCNCASELQKLKHLVTVIVDALYNLEE